MGLNPGKFCPLIRKECVGLKCAWYIQVMGTNPNTGQELNEWACAVSWVPTLIIETSQQSRQAGAAVESFRNEVVKANEENRRAYSEGIQQLIMSSMSPHNVIPTTVTEVNLLDDKGENS